MDLLRPRAVTAPSAPFERATNVVEQQPSIDLEIDIAAAGADCTEDLNQKQVVLVGYGEMGEALGERIDAAAKHKYKVSYIARTGSGARRSRSGHDILSFDDRFSEQRSVDILVLCVDHFVARELLTEHAETISNSQCECILFPGHFEIDGIGHAMERLLVYSLQTLSAYSLKREYSTTSMMTCFVKQGRADPEALALCESFISDLGLFPQPFYGDISALNHQRIPSHWNAAWMVTACFFLVFLLYAVVRYNIFKGYEWADKFLVTVTNKAVCWVALHLLAVTFTPTVFISLFRRFHESGRRRECAPKWLTKWLAMRKELGLIAFLLSVLHVFLSVSRSITDKLEEDSLLAGNVAFVGLCVVALTSMPSIARDMTWRQWVIIQRRGGLLMLFLSTLHVVLMGHRGWTQSELWPGNMPPITMTSTVFPMSVIVARALTVIAGLHPF